MDFQVIRATKEFAFDMGYVHSYSWQEAYTGIIPDEIIRTFTPKNRAKIFLDVLKNPLEEYYLFKVDDRPVPSRFMRKIVCRLRLNEVSRQ